MYKNISRCSIILLSAIAFVLILSLFLYFFIDNVHVTRTFFFPGRNGNLSGETRRLPHKKTKETEIQQFVEELILGPIDINHNRLIPEDTRLLTVMYRHKNTVYLDFSADFVVHDKSMLLNAQQMVSGIKKNITYNFPFVKHIIVAVNGEQLHVE